MATNYQKVYPGEQPSIIDTSTTENTTYLCFSRMGTAESAAKWCVVKLVNNSGKYIYYISGGTTEMKYAVTDVANLPYVQGRTSIYPLEPQQVTGVAGISDKISILAGSDTGGILITGTDAVTGSWDSIVVQTDCVINEIKVDGVDVTTARNFNAKTLLAGTFIGAGAGKKITSVKLTSGTVMAY